MRENLGFFHFMRDKIGLIGPMSPISLAESRNGGPNDQKRFSENGRGRPLLPGVLLSKPFREYVSGPIIGFPFDTTLVVARICYDGLRLA
jgi:hypothetical protein